MKMKKIVQVLGPTGIGKSGVAVRLAERIGGEIISADSMQVYKDFNIGTDKIHQADRKNIPHHLIDILSDCSQFNASMFLEKSFETAEDIAARGKVPVVCGGTALYLKTMIKGIFPESKERRVSRETLNRIADRRGLLCLWNKLNRVDPEYALKVGKNDRVRIVRAMEIFYNNGVPPSQLFRKTQTPFRDYEFIRVGLNMERDKLYSRIEKRVDDMIARGLLEEVIRLRETYAPECPPFKSVGYKEIMMYLDRRDLCFEDAVDLIKQHSRNFAKRQLSWFRQEKDIEWFDPDRFADIEKYVLTMIKCK